MRTGKDGLKNSESEALSHLEGSVVLGREDAPAYVRNLAMRADIAVKSVKESVLGLDNWRERCGQIRRLRRLVV